MKEQNISLAYAKAIIGLGEDQNIDVAKELTTLSEVINSANDLETLLFLDVFTTDEKHGVLSEVATKLNLSPIVKHFLFFLLEEKRMGLFPMIFKNVVVMDDHKKGFLRGTVEGQEATISDDALNKLKAYLKKEMGKEAELKYIQTDKVTAGYRVTVDDLQLDATLDNQLNKFKQEILNS